MNSLLLYIIIIALLLIFYCTYVVYTSIYVHIHTHKYENKTSLTDIPENQIL